MHFERAAPIVVASNRRLLTLRSESHLKDYGNAQSLRMPLNLKFLTFCFNINISQQNIPPTDYIHTCYLQEKEDAFVMSTALTPNLFVRTTIRLC